MIEYISNEELRADMLPEPNDVAGIRKFCSTFNGYEYFGSFEASSKSAKEKKRENLTDLRNELFFSWRASRHTDSDDFIEKYKELLPYFKNLLND